METEFSRYTKENNSPYTSVKLASQCQTGRRYRMMIQQFWRRRCLRDICSLVHFWVPALIQRGELCCERGSINALFRQKISSNETDTLGDVSIL